MHNSSRSCGVVTLVSGSTTLHHAELTKVLRTASDEKNFDDLKDKTTMDGRSEFEVAQREHEEGSKRAID